MNKIFTISGAGFMMIAVALGAFGAHGLGELLQENGREATYDTATLYLMIHAIALIITGFYLDRYPHNRLATIAGGCFIGGMLLFSGSLYILSVGNIGFMGAIAPIGGILFILGWGLLALSRWRVE